ncbi:hypothetical protein Amsp01_096900 [Amycolatopsis sp. NBRC 101858]|uniref:hypothetical protein n=1 Tax=Amycolatopsis sp. NBRC 101858 TaxID=3032200 RepID=UPI0024A0AA2B|nr:hypothetical protein [Amycolatopsis sp. NBRC 101858]GLY43667.1 hypothetical protein Amsp01_096900 [Amycolatopsis sp. NBRC 101858]
MGDGAAEGLTAPASAGSATRNGFTLSASDATGLAANGTFAMRIRIAWANSEPDRGDASAPRATR